MPFLSKLAVLTHQPRNHQLMQLHHPSISGADTICMLVTPLDAVAAAWNCAVLMTVWQVTKAGYAASYRLEGKMGRLQDRLDCACSQHGRVWHLFLSMHMLASDAIFPKHPTPNGDIRRTTSPQTGLQHDLSHPRILAHRIFNIMDVDGDGVIGWRDLCEFTAAHIRTGSLDWRALWDEMKGRPYSGQMLGDEEEGCLVDWQAGRCWDRLREAFAAGSDGPNWRVRCVCNFCVVVCACSSPVHILWFAPGSMLFAKPCTKASATWEESLTFQN